MNPRVTFTAMDRGTREDCEPRVRELFAQPPRPFL